MATRVNAQAIADPHTATQQARGVHAAEDRDRLIQLSSLKAAAPDQQHDEFTGQDSRYIGDGYTVQSGDPLPGVETIWELGQSSGIADSAARRVQIASQRLVDLSQMLGSNNDINIAQMVLREPALMTADLSTMTKRLFQFRISLGARLDVSRLLEKQPSLLLEGTTISGVVTDELLHSWKHGISSDTASEWTRQLGHLAVYRKQFGDSHVGYRAEDDRELARWCKKQRSAFQRDALKPEQVNAMRALEFEFDDERAEWKRWFAELQAFSDEHGSVETGPFTAQSEFYLTNWCSVQRIAKRSGVLSEERASLLDSIGFDWSGADPLS